MEIRSFCDGLCRHSPGARAVGDGGAAAWTTMRSCAHPATAQRSRIRRDDRRGNLHHFFHRVTHFMGSGFREELQRF